MASMAPPLVAFFAFLFFVSTAHSSPDCPTVNKQLASCVTFVKGGAAQPSQSCCNGAKELSNSIHSNRDRQDICMCLKQALAQIGTYQPAKLPQVAKKCGLNLNLPPIDQNTDCSKSLLGTEAGFLYDVAKQESQMQGV